MYALEVTRSRVEDLRVDICGCMVMACCYWFVVVGLLLRYFASDDDIDYISC